MRDNARQGRFDLNTFTLPDGSAISADTGPDRSDVLTYLTLQASTLQDTADSAFRMANSMANHGRRDLDQKITY
jgi:hypothetical protein